MSSPAQREADYYRGRCDGMESVRMGGFSGCGGFSSYGPFMRRMGSMCCGGFMPSMGGFGFSGFGSFGGFGFGGFARGW